MGIWYLWEVVSYQRLNNNMIFTYEFASDTFFSWKVIFEGSIDVAEMKTSKLQTKSKETLKEKRLVFQKIILKYTFF